MTTAIWQKPAYGLWKVNCDASFNASENEGRAAFICRDYSGNLITYAVKNIHSYSTAVAEAEAVRMACYFVRNHNISTITIESDAKAIIIAINAALDNKSVEIDWKFVAIMEDIVKTCGPVLKSLLTRFVHVKGEANSVAYWLAKTRLDPSQYQNHPKILEILLKDSFGIPTI